MKLKTITLICALAWLFLLTSYASFIVGTLTHELTHQRYAIDKQLIEVNYDASGKAYAGAYFKHSHEWVYLNGIIVEVSMIGITTLSVFIIRGYK